MQDYHTHVCDVYLAVRILFTTLDAQQPNRKDGRPWKSGLMHLSNQARPLGCRFSFTAKQNTFRTVG